VRKLSWEWLAGFIDGEGSIQVQPFVSVKKGRRYAGLHLGIFIYQKRPRVLRAIRAFLNRSGCEVVQLMDYSERTSGYGRQHWRVALTNQYDLRIVVAGVTPYLHVKHREAARMARALAARRPYRATGMVAA
jgi:hypothetical protein